MSRASLQTRLRGTVDGVVGDTAVPVVEARPPFGLKLARQYQKENLASFPSWDAFRWFLRRHRKTLVSAGVVHKWRGELCIDPEKFEAVARDCTRLTVDGD